MALEAQGIDMAEQKHFLMGKTICNIKVAACKQAILFVCTDGEHIAFTYAEGDSDTWIESVEAPALGFPCTVSEVERLYLRDRWFADGEECSEEQIAAEDFYSDRLLQVYGINVKTDKGSFVIDFRNASNGSYGGDLIFPDNPTRDSCLLSGYGVDKYFWLDIPQE